MKPGLERGQNDVFQLVGKVRRVKQTQRRPAQNISFLRLCEFGTDQRGVFQAHLHRRVAAGFQPVHQPRNLRGTAGTVRALDHDQLARQIFQRDAGNAVPVITAALFGAFGIGHRFFHAAKSSSVSFTLLSGGSGGGNGSGLAAAEPRQVDPLAHDLAHERPAVFRHSGWRPSR